MIPAHAGDWAGQSLGERTVHWDRDDAILYALAVGARAEDLDLIFEDRLRVLPTFALTLAQWAPDSLGSRGAFDTRTAVHGSQQLRVLASLPTSGSLTLSASVGKVWDKGSAAVFEVEVTSDCFVATWSLFAPGYGGFGGERGPGRPADDASSGTPLEVKVPTYATQAATYRLLGDRHHMHVDPEAARAAGQPKPFLHGLCTMAAASLPLARTLGAHPADLTELDGRFAAPVFPGEELTLTGHSTGRVAEFEMASATGPVITGARIAFG